MRDYEKWFFTRGKVIAYSKENSLFQNLLIIPNFKIFGNFRTKISTLKIIRYSKLN